MDMIQVGFELVKKPWGPATKLAGVVNRDGVNLRRGLAPLPGFPMEKINADILGLDMPVSYRPTDTIQDVVAMCFDNNLRARACSPREKAADHRLAGRVQMGFGVLDQQRASRAGGQAGGDYGQHMGDAEPNVGWAEIIPVGARPDSHDDQIGAIDLAYLIAKPGE